MHVIKCSFTETHKSFPMHFSLTVGVKFLKFIVTHLYCTKYSEIKYFIQLYKSIFVYRITQKISDISWVTLGNGWVCNKLFFMFFFPFILNFNALCNAYTVQIQSYTVLLKSNRIICLILGITFGSYFLSVSKEVYDHFLLYFVLFLNYPPMYEEIDC